MKVIIIRILKYFWCKLFHKNTHRTWIYNIYGDEINLCGGKRSAWACLNCGSMHYHEYLHDYETRGF